MKKSLNVHTMLTGIVASIFAGTLSDQINQLRDFSLLFALALR
jgi:hypothetical protein